MTMPAPKAVPGSLTLVRQSVAIADKNPMVRAGLSELVARDGRFQVAAAVATGSEFISLAETRKIEIGIIGWSLPDMQGGDVLETLKRRHAPTRVIVYTGDAAHKVLRQTIKSGGWGFISKSDDPATLIDVIATVSKGRLCFPYVDLETLDKDPLEILTARELELLAALANGWSNLQIAARIGISHNTVKYHLKNLYDKLGVNNRAMAVALYVSHPTYRDVRPG